jgi:hypothetical protein
MMQLTIVRRTTHSMIGTVPFAPIPILLAASIPTAFHAPVMLKKLDMLVYLWDTAIILLVMTHLVKVTTTAMMTAGIHQTSTIKTCAVMMGGTMEIPIDGQTTADTFFLVLAFTNIYLVPFSRQTPADTFPFTFLV